MTDSKIPENNIGRNKKKGYVPHYRSMHKSYFGRNLTAYAIFNYLLESVSYEDKYSGGKLIIQAGEYPYSIGLICEHFDISRDRVRRALRLLEEGNTISVKVQMKRAIIKIINFNAYKVRNSHDLNETSNETSNGTRSDTRNKEIKKKRNTLVTSTDVSAFVEAWNELKGILPSVQKMTTKRTQKIKVRLAEEPDLEYWRSVIKKMAASDFCRSGKWASIDWLVANDNNHVKVSDGNYDNKASTSPPVIEKEPCKFCNGGLCKIGTGVDFLIKICNKCDRGRNLKGHEHREYLSAEDEEWLIERSIS